MRTIIAILFLAAISFAVYFFLIQDPIKREISLWKVHINLEGFKKTKLVQNRSTTSNIEQLEAVKQDLVVKITKISINDHKKYIEDKKFLLQSLYLPTTSPYPEVLTNMLECPSEFKPKSQDVQNGVIYTLLAGERLNYGICVKDLIKYYSVYGIFDCAHKGVFEIRVFSRDQSDTLESIVKSFSC